MTLLGGEACLNFPFWAGTLVQQPEDLFLGKAI